MTISFSVVIPLYNKAYSVKYCLDSVFNQTFKGFEVIVVDDGSTDSSLSLVKSTYKKEVLNGLLNIVEQHNQGVSVARNNGVKSASFEYVCFLDADDEWKPDYLDKMSSLVRDFPLANLYCLAHLVSKNSSEPIKAKHGLSDSHYGYVDDFFYASSKGSVANSSKVCVSKATFLKVGGFPKGVVAGEDLYLWILFALEGKVACSMSYLAIVYQEDDESRCARKNTVPYPFVYFSKNKSIKKTRSLNKYFFRLFYKHFLASVLNFRFKEAGLRLYYYLRVYS